MALPPSLSLRRFCTRACYLAATEKALQWHDGRARVRMRGHPRADPKGMVLRAILVAEASLGRAVRPDEDVHHLNGVRSDDRPENLQVLSRSEHRRLHALAMGLGRMPASVTAASRPKPHLWGERGTAARLTAAQVLEIRAAYAAGGVTLRQLAEAYGVVYGTIDHIVHRRTWRHL